MEDCRKNTVRWPLKAMQGKTVFRIFAAYLLTPMHRGPIRTLSIAALLLALLIVACGKEKAPAGILPEAEMAPLLCDMQIAYAGVEHTVQNPRERNRKIEEMNQAVLKKHGYAKDEFYKSYQWYQERPEVMDSLFQQVIRLIQQEMDAVQSGGKGPAAQQQMPPQP
jgi:Domain of unknown function (DUF4296)